MVKMKLFVVRTKNSLSVEGTSSYKVEKPSSVNIYMSLKKRGRACKEKFTLKQTELLSPL